MTITALPFRTAIAVVVLAVFAAISIPPTRADDTPPESTTTTTAASTTTTVAETTTTVADTTTTTAPATTTTVAETTTTVADTTTTTAPATTTTAAATTTTTAPTTTTTTAPATTTTTAAPTTTTTTLPPEPEVLEVETIVCVPETDPTAVDTGEESADTGEESADAGDTTSTVTTTTLAADGSQVDATETTTDANEEGTQEAVEGEEAVGDADADPCTPPEDDELGFTPIERIEVVRDIVFPIAGRAGYYDGFGACRDGCTREHFGIDIGTYGWKGVPVVAIEDGTVIRTTYDQRLAGCAVILRGYDGWESRYVHLNTDFPGTDTDGYKCLAPGIEVGSEVVAGQIIAWVGDSGNAEHTTPHIHFEIRTPDGIPVNSYESLKAARTIEFDWLSQDPSAAYNTVVASNYSTDPATAIVVSAAEARKLSADEGAASIFDSPVIVIDEANPDAALEQIKRLDLDRAVIVSDLDAHWISELLAPLVGLVETETFPPPYAPPVRIMPDSGDPVPTEANPADRFATIISGSLDDIDPEYLEAFDLYTMDHRSIVLSTGSEGVTDLSSIEGPTPTRSEESEASSVKARRASNSEEPPTPLPLWWNTGDEWVWTDNPLDVPGRGIAYLTAAQATPWTLAFLSSLVEIENVPLWRG